MVQEFSKEYWEGVHHQTRLDRPVLIAPGDMPDEHRLFSRYLDARGGTVFEIGCAPGRWLAYFAKQFGMKVAGIDYAEEALHRTRANLEMQGIEADLAVADFFTTELPDSQYDVVYSRGFIEHFPDTQGVVDRLCRVAREHGGYVVTTVPNFLGLNGWLRKKTAPASYAGHVAISAARLRELHENVGIQTLFCGYAGVPCVILVKDTPSGGITRSGRLRQLVPTIINVASRRVCRAAHRVPRSRLLSPTVLYIGRRR